MTGLIIFIIVSLLGYFFSGSQQKTPQKTRPSSSKKGLNEYFEEMKEKMAQAEKELQKNTPTAQRRKEIKTPPLREKQTEVVEQKAAQPVEVMTRRQDRKMERIVEESKKQKVDHAKTHPLFRNSDDLRRAIIVSEVLGPPKSKRK